MPLRFSPGEAYQFDWSHEVVLINGVTSIVVAQSICTLRAIAGHFVSRHCVGADSPPDFDESAAARLDSLPILLIDDEADQASINTRGNRAPDPSLDSDNVAAVSSGPGPTATNALIRSILGRARQAAYTAGLAAAKARGRLGGRPPALRDTDLRVAHTLLKAGQLTIAEIAERLHVAPSTLYKHLPRPRSSTNEDGPLESPR